MAAVYRRMLRRGERIRVMVVDDSAVIRRMITRALEQDPSIEVVGSASNGAIGLQLIPELNPDVVTLDIEMPEMDGLDMLRRIRRDHPLIRVIMLSTLTQNGAAVTLEALTLGADDYSTKATNEGSLTSSMARMQEELIPKVKQFFRFLEVGTFSGGAVSVPPPAKPLANEGAQANLRKTSRPRALVIGASTGGPVALSAVLPQLQADFPLPVLVVQHMPPLFTRLFAERLNSICALSVEEARDGSLVERGKVLIAPGDYHMTLASSEGRVRVCLDQSAPQNYCRPAVDALFVSSADVYGGDVLAVILTGMGKDGLYGTQMLQARGANILAQDEASSVVWGMPGVVVKAGLADRVLPLAEVGAEILRMSGRGY